MTDPQPTARHTWSGGRPAFLALSALAFLVVGLIVWSSNAQIVGAVIGSGAIEKTTTMTAVQHPRGGVVEEVFVRDGEHVAAGQILARLDGSVQLSDLAATEAELFEVLANIARLEAVIEDRREMIFPALFEEARATRPELARLVRRQEAQLTDHYAMRETEAQLLDEQIAQVEAQIAGTEAELAAKEDEALLIAAEMENARQLEARNLIKASDMFDVQRREATLRGAIGGLQARLAELRGKVSELSLKALTVAPELRETAAAELARQRPLRARYMEGRLKLLDELAKLEIRAPIPGTIHDFRVEGRLSVVTAAKPLMMIVPEDDGVQVRVRIASTDIDQVYLGQPASLRFHAFSRRSLPIVLGEVTFISADAYEDPKTRKFYHEAAVAIPEAELSKLGDRQLIVGMPVDAHLSTVTQTPLDYVMAPLQVYLDRAFRDT